MSDCCETRSEEAKNWPEGIISVKLTMNPYLLAMAIDESEKKGIRVWELINTALWEKLGSPGKNDLMEYAADMEIYEEDPKWKKRLKITARHEVLVDAVKKERAQNPGLFTHLGDDDGEGRPR